MYTTVYYNGIETDYLIDKHGNIKSKKNKNKFLKHHYTKKGYAMVKLYLRDGRKVTVQVHRLMIMSWYPDKDITNLEVHHLDYKNKSNDLDKLVYCTHEQHVSQERLIGHKERPCVQGEKHHNSKYKESDIRSICEYLSKGFGITDIYNLINGVVSKDTICKIKARQHWVSISKDYDF